jgi:hypothetical protein
MILNLWKVVEVILPTIYAREGGKEGGREGGRERERVSECVCESQSSNGFWPLPPSRLELLQGASAIPSQACCGWICPAVEQKPLPAGKSIKESSCEKRR